MFTEKQKQMLIDALNMYTASNKRMQQSKPQFQDIFKQIDAELTTLLSDVKNMKTKTLT